MSRRPFFLALENEVVEEITPVVPAEEIIESASNTEEASVEVTEASGDVAELQEAIEEGLQGAETLASIGDAVEAKVESGEGLDETSAQIAEIAIESIRERLGFPKPAAGRGFPALENFKSHRSRTEATRIALEASIQDGIKKVWEQVKKFAAAVWEKIKTFIGTLMKNYGILIAHLEKLKARAATLTAAKAEKDMLEKPNLAKFFTGMTPSEALKTVNSFEGSLSSVLDHMGSFSTAEEIGPKLAVAAKELNGKKLPNGLTVKFEGDGDSFDVVMEKGKVDGETIKALTADEAGSLADEAIAAAKNGAKLKDVAAKTEKVTKAVIATADKVSKIVGGAGGDKADEKKAAYKAASKAANSTIKVVSKISAQLPSLHFATVKASADLISASLNNLKGEKKEAKAA